MKPLANAPLESGNLTDSAFKLHYNIWLIDPGNLVSLKVAVSGLTLITVISPII